MHQKFLKYGTLALAFCALNGFAASTLARTEPKVTRLDFSPERILIVGNSYMYYNCGLNGYLGGLIRVNINPKIKTRIAAIGRSNMSQQPLAEMLDNTRLASHTAQTRPLDKELLEKEVKKRETYDLVLLQASNRGTDDQMRDAYYIPEHIKAVKAQGGTPAMILTWVQRNKSAPAQTLVNEAVTKIANDNDIMVIPVGPAFEAAQAALPDLKLIMPDKTHPTAAGSYLMAATIYGALYERNPLEASSFEGGCEKPLPEALRQKLCEIAWQTVKTFYGREEK